MCIILIFVYDQDIRQLINNLKCIYYFGALNHDNIYKFIDKLKTYYTVIFMKVNRIS